MLFGRSRLRPDPEPAVGRDTDSVFRRVVGISSTSSSSSSCSSSSSSSTSSSSSSSSSTTCRLN